ncbi:MAG: TerB family tellurite resistance protein [Rubrimonas sp.]|uniref:tellurite resistance TerB family protein n=1 Tax=Rubrimonas sp. TaxID=2036015 RepID=UPI002FDE4ACF
MARMLDAIRKFFAAPEAAAAADDPVVAVAALLVELARADADYTDAERVVVEHLLAGLFDLDAAEARRARLDGEAAQARAADLVRFTRVVKTQLSEADRVALMEGLWSVALSDGTRDPHEDALLRKLAPLIAVTDRDSAEARMRALARGAGTDGGAC